jgi:hypothetical protein
MPAIAPKHNPVRSFPSRVAVVIEPSRGGAVMDSTFLDDLAGKSEDIGLSRADQAD